jgi:glyoxylase-like metal-dependent hydrolase (beta-lactamase superfamily II)
MNTSTYVLWDQETKDAVVIDPVLNYDTAASQTSEVSAGLIIDFLHLKDLKLHFILETHAHADHLSGSQIIKRAYPQAQIAIGAEVPPLTKPLESSGFRRLVVEQTPPEEDRLTKSAV